MFQSAKHVLITVLKSRLFDNYQQWTAKENTRKKAQQKVMKLSYRNQHTLEIIDSKQSASLHLNYSSLHGPFQ